MTCISLVVSLVAAIYGPALFIFQLWGILLDSCASVDGRRYYHKHTQTVVKASYSEPPPQRCQDEPDANPLMIDGCCHVLTWVVQDCWQDESLATVKPYNQYFFGFEPTNISHWTDLNVGMGIIKNYI